MADFALLGSRPRETDNNTQMQQQAQALVPKRVSTRGWQLLALHKFTGQKLLE